VNALANKEVGDYLNDHFVTSYQKVGTFRVVNGQKQGGNVASYFCTPDGGLLDAIAGPVDAKTLLKEARWVVETRKMALLESRGDVAKYKAFFRLAHANMIPAAGELRQVNWQQLPLYKASPDALESVLEQTPGARQLDKQGRVHLLLAAFPLVKIDQAYKVVYNKIVGEQVSTSPVAEGNAPSLGQPVERNWDKKQPARLVRYSPLLDRPAAPSPDEMRAQAKARELLHALNEANVGEINSGSVLNVLLADLQDRKEVAGDAGSARLTPEILAHINVTSVTNGGSFGLLRDGTELAWPLPWHEAPLAVSSGDLRQSVQEAINNAVAQGKKGRINPETLARLDSDLTELNKLLARNVFELQPTPFIEAKRYLRQLADVLEVLQRKDVAKYIDGAMALDPARIRNVRELIAYMTEHGLTFAAAVAGDEAAYRALHHALADYDRVFEVDLTTDSSAL
jgi:hypothetical protein